MTREHRDPRDHRDLAVLIDVARFEIQHRKREIEEELARLGKTVGDSRLWSELNGLDRQLKLAFHHAETIERLS